MILDPSGKTVASIHLDYGADSADFDFENLHVCTRGLRMKTRWCFAAGTELSVNFQITEPAAPQGVRLLKTQGVVVGCDPAGDGEGYAVTVLFLEITDDIQVLIRDLCS